MWWFIAGTDEECVARCAEMARRGCAPHATANKTNVHVIALFNADVLFSRGLASVGHEFAQAKRLNNSALSLGSHFLFRYTVRAFHDFEPTVDNVQHTQIGDDAIDDGFASEGQRAGFQEF